MVVTGLLLFGLAVVLTRVPDLDQLRGRYRVVLLFAPDSRDPRLLEQREQFEKSATKLAERDMQVIEVAGESAESRALRSKLEVRREEFAVVLIGKDGSSKLHRTKAVPPAELFQLVDSMPMRRDEMQRRK